MNLGRETIVGHGLVTCIVLGLAVFGFAQSRPSRSPEAALPSWELKTSLKHDVFTFVRVRYNSQGFYRSQWDGDYPESDLNFSYRLQELTSLEVNPEAVVIQLMDESLFDYPFLYMISPGNIDLSEREVVNLRRYLENGGFLMIDDFWGREEWEHVRRQMERVFPKQRPRELGLSHPIFHMVFPLEQIPQVPSIRAWAQGYDYEPWHNDMSDHAPHFMGYFDSNGRLVALLCHNNDLGDGWEREGENHEYFKKYSERWSYPIGINIVMYAMTH